MCLCMCLFTLWYRWYDTLRYPYRCWGTITQEAPFPSPGFHQHRHLQEYQHHPYRRRLFLDSQYHHLHRQFSGHRHLM